MKTANFSNRAPQARKLVAVKSPPPVPHAAQPAPARSAPSTPPPAAAPAPGK